MVDRLERRDPPDGEARAVAVLLHGRGADPESMLSLADALPPLPITWLAPAAPRGTWYPQSFLAPIDANQPWLDRALATVDEVVAGVGDRSRVVLLGFSQGACLAAEYALRNPGRYGGLVLLTGGAIGPAGTTWEGPADFDATPVFCGTADPDPHVPVQRVRDTADVLGRRGAEVAVEVYPGMGHTVNADELQRTAALLADASR